MSKISYARHRFPPAIIQRAVWLYFRFPLSFRDVEEMLAERGINVSYETIRRWILKFGPAIAANAEGVIDVLVGDDVEYLCALIDEYTA